MGCLNEKATCYMIGGFAMERLLKEREAAALLGISDRHLFSLRKRGEVPYIRLGGRVLYSPEALQKWIERRLQAVEVQAAAGPQAAAKSR